MDKQQIEEKIDELWDYDEYEWGPEGARLKYKHQGWIDSLNWVLGRNQYDEP